jgi:acetyl-CoA carboxylase biotin carboxyl carrier protein
MNLTNEDVADILALLDSLPYDELDLQTSSFRLTLRRTPDGWTQSTQSLASPLETASPVPTTSSAPQAPLSPVAARAGTPSMPHWGGNNPLNVTSSKPDDSASGTSGSERDSELVSVRAPLPGTFYRAPRPGAEPFVEVGSEVGADTVVGIVETMKLMNSVTAGVSGTVAEFCVGNAEFAAQGAPLLRIRTGLSRIRTGLPRVETGS